jgi:hypothetical protein
MWRGGNRGVKYPSSGGGYFLGKMRGRGEARRGRESEKLRGERAGQGR